MSQVDCEIFHNQAGTGGKTADKPRIFEERTTDGHGLITKRGFAKSMNQSIFSHLACQRYLKTLWLSICVYPRLFAG
jgi:hypothetical protein